MGRRAEKTKRISNVERRMLNVEGGENGTASERGWTGNTLQPEGLTTGEDDGDQGEEPDEDVERRTRSILVGVADRVPDDGGSGRDVVLESCPPPCEVSSS